LEAAKHLLEHGKHDYAGHRAKAVHEVTQAIKDLEHHHRHHSAHSPMNAQGGTPGKQGASMLGGKMSAKAEGKKPGTAEAGREESQGQSDEMLHKALHELEAVLKELGKHEHHKKAVEAIEAAIHELHKALKIA
jgi:hypothetical protein